MGEQLSQLSFVGVFMQKKFEICLPCVAELKSISVYTLVKSKSSSNNRKLTEKFMNKIEIN